MTYGPHTWPADTRVWLTRVPWDANYRDLVSWDNTARNAWFNEQRGGQSIVLDKASYLPMNRPIKLPLNIDLLTQYNYVRVTNTVSDGYARDYFYFIMGAEYLTPDTTNVQLQLDDWQTWHNDVEMTRSYVERGHVGIADTYGQANEQGQFGQTLLTLPEGLDTGAFMPTTAQFFHDINEGTSTAIAVTSTINLAKDPGSITDPKISSATGSDLELAADAASVYIFDRPGEYQNMLTAFTDMPWMLQGIINVTAIPKTIFELAKVSYPLTLESISVPGKNGGAAFTFEYWASDTTGGPIQADPFVIQNFRAHFKLPDRYRVLGKFQTFPYCSIEMTNYSGQSMIIEPERVFSTDLVIHEIASIRPGSMRAVFYPKRYGSGIPTTDLPDGMFDGGEYVNHAVTTDQFPEFSVLTNSGIMYMAKNAHSIAYQRNAATWAQNKALQGADVQASQADKSIQGGISQTGNEVNAMRQGKDISNAMSVASGLMSAGNAVGNANVGGAVAAAVGTGINIAGNEANYNIQSNKMHRARSIDTDVSGYMRDTNKAYANYSAQGDYQNAIAGINATVQDTQLQAPGVQGAVGGDSLMMWYGTMGVKLNFKQIGASAMRAIGEYWLRFGYYVQAFVTPPEDYHVMSHFTYWKMKDTYVRSVFAPEDVCATIRGIFENGVTVWRNPDDIGLVDFGDNTPLYNNYLNIDETL